MNTHSDENSRSAAIALIKFVVDKLPGGYTFPCSVQEIKKVLQEIPLEHLNGIKRIRLSAQKVTLADASYIDGTINIYAVPRDLKFLYTEKPPESILREYSRFGARWDKLGDAWYCYWKLDHYKRYILEHVLFHELGHHIDDFHSERRSFGKEKFAERYALDLENRLKNGKTM
ncbi:MAG: hypothetical protein AB9903_19605 [Vulcanimicrobiota bacterium]